MRILKEISHPKCRITVFHWNGKYILKLEQGSMEQTYKVPESEVPDDQAALALLTDEFLEKVFVRFKGMQTDLFETLNSSLP